MKKYALILILALCVVPLNIKAQGAYEIEELPFNTREFDEYYPVLFSGELLFVSNRKRDFLKNVTDPSGSTFSDLYRVSQGSDGKWSGNSVFLSEELTMNSYEGPFTIDPSNNTIYFTMNYNSSKGLGNYHKEADKLGIFTARLVGDQWQNVRKWNYCDENFNYAQPSISPDGTMLFFVSDMDGGYGRSDIYVCRKNGRRWGEPENLGSVINTNGRDTYPYMHSSGRLYFASTEHNSMGGLDIFYSYYDNGTWTEPINAGEPFNSRSHDFGLIMDDDFEEGYFSSSRKRSLDIYKFTRNFPLFETCAEQKKNNYCYRFAEEGSVDLDTTTLKYEWDMGDGTKIRDLKVRHCFSGPGNYLVQLNVIDTLTGETYFNEASYMLELKEREQVFITSLDTAYVNDEITMDGLETHFPGLEIKDYFWFFGDGNVTKGTTVNHSYKKPGTYVIRLGIQGTRPENEDEIISECGSKTIIVQRRFRN